MEDDFLVAVLTFMLGELSKANLGQATGGKTGTTALESSPEVFNNIASFTVRLKARIYRGTSVRKHSSDTFK